MPLSPANEKRRGRRSLEHLADKLHEAQWEAKTDEAAANWGETLVNARLRGQGLGEEEAWPREREPSIR